MAKRSPWESRSLLDLHPWSLLPVVGLSKAGAIAAQVTWAGFVILFLVQRPLDWLSLVVSWLVGAWAVFYITQRLGGREAIFAGVSTVRFDSPFQVRLIGDAMCVFVLVLFAGVVVFGASAIRALWSQL